MGKHQLNKHNIKAKLISTVHDSIVLDSPDNEIQLIASLFDQIFRDLPTLIKRLLNVSWNVPMRCEIKIGKNMLDLTKITIDNDYKICNNK